ncbi:MAG: 2-hydroxyacid dehydrogenase [Salegentibacter sp.]
MKVAVFSTKDYDREFLGKFNENYGHEITFFEAPLNEDTANLAQDFKAICAFVNDKMDANTLARIAGHGIKLIALRCAGFNNVDLKAAAQNGIEVRRVPAYSPQAVAEHAVALIMTLNRKTHKAYNRIREGNFSLEKLLGFNVFGKTVGVIGTGEIGAAFCNIMLGFGCKVVAYDVQTSEELSSRGVEYLSLEKLLQRADIISIHCPLVPQTRHLMNSSTFAQMKKGAMLINTSRGAVIDTQDAVEALKSGQLGYLGIDVYEQEENLFFRDLSESIIPDDLISRLIGFPNVLITSHQGFFTQEALDQIATTTLQNISDFEKGQETANIVRIKK